MSVETTGRRWRPAALVAALAAALGACDGSPAGPAAGDVVPGEYIVRLEDRVQDVEGLARQRAARAGGTLLGVVQHTIKAFGVRLPEPVGPRLRLLRAHPDVQRIEPNARIYPAAEGG